MAIKKRLLLTFMNSADKKVSLTVDEPREDILEAEIKDLMETIVTNDVFLPGGENLVAAVEAKVVVTDTTEYDLV